jgi:hypothetical protein
MTDAVIYLAQYEYVDEPGSFWPARAFPCRDKAEQYATQMTAGVREHKRVYSVVPIILESRETTRKRSLDNSNPRLF